MLTDQETIERAVIGKRIAAMSWLPVDADKDVFELESVTLEGGTKLNLSIWYATFGYRIVAGIKEGGYANA
jgi:hypothetical protein